MIAALLTVALPLPDKVSEPPVGAVHVPVFVISVPEVPVTPMTEVVGVSVQLAFMIIEPNVSGRPAVVSADVLVVPPSVSDPTTVSPPVPRVVVRANAPVCGLELKL